jgi:hydrogenase maturation protease
MRAAAVCLGSRERGDDAAGPLIGDRLASAGATLLDCGEDPTRLLDLWAGLELVVIVDAVRSGAPAGTVHQVELAAGAPAGVALATSHAVTATDALAMARALGRAPHRAILIGVEGTAFGIGDPMTPAVAAALDAAATAVLEALR